MKSIFLNLLLICVTLILLSLILELGLRVSGYTPQVLHHTRIGQKRIKGPLPKVRYLYQPYADYNGFWPDDPRGYFQTDDHSLRYRINNYGFRGNDFSITRGDKLRIAVIGDSFCWGSGVKEHHRFTALVEDSLNKHKVLGQQFELYNFCLPGFNTENEVALYQQIVQYFQPDLLLVSYFLNDVNLPGKRSFWYRPWQPESLTKWREYIYILDWLIDKIGIIITHDNFTEKVIQAYQSNHPGYRSVAANLAKLAEINEQNKVPTLLVIFPWLADLNQDSYPFDQAHRAIRTLADKHNFSNLDLFSVFTGRRPDSLWVHAVDHHPNEIAHRLAADAIYEAVAELLKINQTSLLTNAKHRQRMPSPGDFSSPKELQWYKNLALSAPKSPPAEMLK